MDSKTITFKVDPRLAELLGRMPNRSEFIRQALMSALDSSCPLCSGTGILTPEQRRHWQEFCDHHTVRECDDCHAWHIVCEAEETENHNHHPGSR